MKKLFKQFAKDLRAVSCFNGRRPRNSERKKESAHDDVKRASGSLGWARHGSYNFRQTSFKDFSRTDGSF